MQSMIIAFAISTHLFTSSPTQPLFDKGLKDIQEKITEEANAKCSHIVDFTAQFKCRVTKETALKNKLKIRGSATYLDEVLGNMSLQEAYTALKEREWLKTIAARENVTIITAKPGYLYYEGINIEIYTLKYRIWELSAKKN